ncbi:hypothetical protein FHS54_000006 [Sphingobium vermicomposti]|uniref:Uncharacterized protein n=1 Tax=Sphingobium vermicomposti TaxID=529005 RepID=A0A846LYT8_9SPHN|nr:hypothetical protein [Sphingobium vermicomposti]
MMNIDGAFLMGVAAILTSVANLWRAARSGGAEEPWHGSCAHLRQIGETTNEKSDRNSSWSSDRPAGR